MHNTLLAGGIQCTAGRRRHMPGSSFSPSSRARSAFSAARISAQVALKRSPRRSRAARRRCLVRARRSAAAPREISLRCSGVRRTRFFLGGAVPARRLRRHDAFIRLLRASSGGGLDFGGGATPLSRRSRQNCFILLERCCLVKRIVPRAVYFRLRPAISASSLWRHANA